MAIESSRGRATLRAGSALVAAVAGSVAVVVVARRRTASRPAPAPALAAPKHPEPPVVLTVPATVAEPPAVEVPAVEEPIPAEDIAPAPPWEALPPPPPLPPPADPDDPRRWWPLAAGAAAAVVLVVAAFTVTGGDDEPSDVVADETEAGTATSDRPSTTLVDDLTPDAAFEQAAARLEAAGSFAYRGSSLATDVSPVRPGLWLKVELTTSGDVDLRSGRLHDVGETTDGRVTETVTDGVTVWGRLADSRDDLPDVDFLTVGDPTVPPRRRGAALLPTWLQASIDREELTGGRRFRATIPAAVFGEVEDGRPAVDAELLLTLDASGDPLHIEITNGPDGPPLHLALDLTALSRPVDIVLPNDPDTTTSP